MNLLKKKRTLLLGCGLLVFFICIIVFAFNYNIYRQESAKLTTILSTQKDGKEDYTTEYQSLLSFKENCKSTKVINQITTRISELNALSDVEYSKISELLKTDNVDISNLQQQVLNYKDNFSYNNKITNIDDFNNLIVQYQKKLNELNKIQKLSENKNSYLEFLQDLQNTENGLENLYKLANYSIDNQIFTPDNTQEWYLNNKKSFSNSIDKLRASADNETKNGTEILFKTSEYDKIGQTLVDGLNIGTGWNNSRLSKFSNSDGKKLADSLNQFKKNKDEVSNLISNKINYLNTCDNELIKLNNDKKDLYNKIINFKI